MAIKVGIMGYGVIGNRVAHAVTKSDDMELVGVAKTRYDFKAQDAIDKGYTMYYVNEAFKGAEKHCEELVANSDIVVDCSPGKKGVENKTIYDKHNAKVLYQGGEKADNSEVSFNAQSNYDACKGKKYTRVVSCNTTGMSRTIGSLPQHKLGKIRVVLVRRAADPVQSKKGPINAIVPVTHVPSHHGPDLKTVLPCDIVSMAVAVPTTIMHQHNIMIQLKEPMTREEVIAAFKANPRVKLFKSEDGYRSTAEIMEYARTLGRYMSDLYEIAVWEDSINVQDNELYWCQAVHQESDVVPENIDAIRAVMGTMSKEESMRKTDELLGIK